MGGPLLGIIGAVLQSMTTYAFLIVLLIILFSFSIAFNILIGTTHTNIFSTIPGSALTLFRNLFIDFETYTEIKSTHQYTAATFLFLCNIVLTSLLLMNLLVALLTDVALGDRQVAAARWAHEQKVMLFQSSSGQERQG